MNVINATKPAEINAHDTDSLSVLPLVLLPLESESLQQLRMVKDSKLESAIEMFSIEGVGAGLVYLPHLRETFPSVTDSDYKMLTAVAELRSFDVYSLRISLRSIGIEVDANEHLRLSETKQLELAESIRPFTEQLIRKVYGSTNDNADAAALVKNPDVATARKSLQDIASALSVPLNELPQFLADYGDIHLSVAYYRSCLDITHPIIDDFLTSINEIKQNGTLKHDLELIKVCTNLEYKFKKIEISLLNRFAVFAKNADDMWENMSAERFEEFRNLVEDNHTFFGGLLCMLTVKMNVWNDKFPPQCMAGPTRRATFIFTEMRQGVLPRHSNAE